MESGVKQELKDMAVQAAVAAPGATWAFFSKVTLGEWIALGLGVLQMLYLLRKWWREETEWGLRMKRWLQRKTRPAELDD